MPEEIQGKKWHQSRTNWVNLLFICGGMIAQIQAVGETIGWSPEVMQTIGAVAAIVGAANLWLRRITKVPILRKKIAPEP